VAARTQARRISHARPARGRKSANPDSPRQRPTDKYPAIANAIARLPAQNGYIDGELRGVLPDGRTAFNLIQNATDTGEGSLVFFLFDLLHLDGENLMAPLLIERKRPAGVSSECCAGLPAIQRSSDRSCPAFPISL
jgi:hypothetical protein